MLKNQMTFSKDAKWIGVPEDVYKQKNIYAGDLTGRFALFRLEFDYEIPKEAINAAGEKMIEDPYPILITVNARYRLWVNGIPVHSGPAKGDMYVQYFDRLDLAPWLVKGKNVLAVQVLWQNPAAVTEQYDQRTAIVGVVNQMGGHRLLVEGKNVTTGIADWRVYLDDSRYLVCDETTENLGSVIEHIDFHKVPVGWKKRSYVMSSPDWPKAVPREAAVRDEFRQMVGLVGKFHLKERQIPLMYEKKRNFDGEFTQTGILKNDFFLVHKHTTEEVLLYTNTLVNAYPVFLFDSGNNAHIDISYAEKFTGPQGEDILRDDWKKGIFHGFTDQLTLTSEECCFEPFWYRTFRFVRIRIQAGEEDVVLKKPYFRQTGYPLQVSSEIRSDVPWIEPVYQMCIRTLKNCMMETYMDCPYYEQMQFPMDTRLMALFTYAVSGDTRLARNALNAYHRSMLPMGLIPGKYPSCYCQIISTFSLHYIFMLWEYYEQTGDLKLLQLYSPDVDRIVSYYERHVGQDGLVGDPGYWPFVDWQVAWKDTGGVPTALKVGPSTIINLMYAYALWDGAKICHVIGRDGLAQEYACRRHRILVQVQQLCWDQERGMYREGPKVQQFSQHAQSWAVLCGLYGTEVREDESFDLNKLTSVTIEKKNAQQQILKNAQALDVIPVSFSTAFEYYRACEMAGCYDLTMENLYRWKKLLDQHCTTCPEEPVKARSECHGWSALPIYEFIRTIAGIHTAKTGDASVVIQPHLRQLLKYKRPEETAFTIASGKVVTSQGEITFCYRYEDKKIHYDITLPKGLEGIFISEEGTVADLKSERQVLVSP